MDTEVAEAVGALLAQRADAIRGEYEHQELVPGYGGTTYESLDTLADSLGGEAPDRTDTVSYDVLETVLDGDAVYHEVLHGETFTSHRPAADAVGRMRLEEDDRTSTGRGLDGAESGLRFHLEEEPFLALWDEDGATRYTAVQVVPEARSASCRPTEVTYPGKVFAITGVLEGTDTETVMEATDAPLVEEDPDDGGQERPGTADACPLDASGEDAADGTRQDDLPEQQDRMAMLEYTHGQFTEDGTFDRATYEGMMHEAADNLEHMAALGNLLMDYLEETVADTYGEDDHDSTWLRAPIEAELDALLDADTVGFEDGTTDRYANFFGALQYTEAVVRYGVSHEEEADDLDAWEDAFKGEHTDAYTTLWREHRKGNIFSLYIPSEDDAEGLQPYRLLDSLFDGDRLDWEALDAAIQDRLPDPDEVGGEPDGFEGNETTRGMYQ